MDKQKADEFRGEKETIEREAMQILSNEAHT